VQRKKKDELSSIQLCFRLFRGSTVHFKKKRWNDKLLCQRLISAKAGFRLHRGFVQVTEKKNSKYTTEKEDDREQTDDIGDSNVNCLEKRCS
jgi:hypothetical protein